MPVDIDVMQFFITGLLLLGFLLWAIPGPCQCAQCTVHGKGGRLKP